ncbi:hypothetical protein BU14_0415s0012 [Porphyra umbilicalis]|uniref:Uncharacterized protein n=1 Tax=Porphyra umbilicalis TaxID=2786 RepID=A0A1X6NVM7_PORUM|nr:hypothetical protein BU14_0415s0012 [Porphyra umbilicalis]|eukprot:OSX72668.1 hypothetical protein BU14_0415s0012 [Porphyra umbilicalis]
MSDGCHVHPSRYTLPLSPPPRLSPSPPLPLPLFPVAHRPDLVFPLALWMRRLWWCFSSYRMFGISHSMLSCILPIVMCLPPVPAPTPFDLHRLLLFCTTMAPRRFRPLVCT